MKKAAGRTVTLETVLERLQGMPRPAVGAVMQPGVLACLRRNLEMGGMGRMGVMPLYAMQQEVAVWVFYEAAVLRAYVREKISERWLREFVVATVERQQVMQEELRKKEEEG